jgi:hypothetical protein
VDSSICEDLQLLHRTLPRTYTLRGDDTPNTLFRLIWRLQNPSTGWRSYMHNWGFAIKTWANRHSFQEHRKVSSEFEDEVIKMQHRSTQEIEGSEWLRGPLNDLHNI